MDDGTELLAITVWADEAALVAVLGPGWREPTWIASVRPYITRGSTEHFSAIANADLHLAALGLIDLL